METFRDTVFYVQEYDNMEWTNVGESWDILDNAKRLKQEFIEEDIMNGLDPSEYRIVSISTIEEVVE